MVAFAAWALRPAAPAAAAAARELAAAGRLAAMADLLDARRAAGLPCVGLPALLGAEASAFEPGPSPGSLARGGWAFAVLLPDRDGIPAPPGKEDPRQAARGYAAVAWPLDPGPGPAALACLPGGVSWRSTEVRRGPPPSSPPPLSVVLPAPGDDPRLALPEGWDALKRRGR
jgi:hypothetical protein